MEQTARFCEHCTSKGVKHKKDCTRPLKPKDVQAQVVEIIKEVLIEKEIVREVEKPPLSDFDLYKALKDKGFFQGGVGQYMESPLTDEKVYLPHASEIYASFAQDPSGWEIIRDYLARAYLDLKVRNG